MKRRQLRRLAACSLAAATLAGCAVGPDFKRPAAPAVTGYSAEAPAATLPGSDTNDTQRVVQGLDIPGQWWMLFHSPELNSLLEQALKANPDLQAAQAALRVANENLAAQRGVYFPTVGASFAPSRNRDPVNTLSPALTSGSPVYSLYTAQVSVSYTLDVFGGNRRLVESSAAQAESQRFQLEATYLTLTSNVVLAAVQEASIRAQIEATEKIIGVVNESLGILRKQLELGAIAESDVVAEETLLAQATATLPVLRKQFAQQRDLIAALAGRFPSDAPAEQFSFDKLQLPQELPLTLPSKLVEQRPDIRAAEANLHAASAQVGVALSNMLPQIAITGSRGGTSTQFDQMFRVGNIFWSVAASLTQTLFDGGMLLHKKRAAEAALDQAGAQYRSTVISAFQNVADTLGALQYDAEALQAQIKAEQTAASGLNIARRSLELGAANYLSLLNAQQAYQQVVIGLAQAKANRYADTAALFQALGGGWWNRTDAGQAQFGAAYLQIQIPSLTQRHHERALPWLNEIKQCV
jgi:NodT family efflux transporter outer membrane factor (OMF) lipoprotein